MVLNKILSTTQSSKHASKKQFLVSSNEMPSVLVIKHLLKDSLKEEKNQLLIKLWKQLNLLSLENQIGISIKNLREILEADHGVEKVMKMEVQLQLKQMLETAEMLVMLLVKMMNELRFLYLLFIENQNQKKLFI